MESFLFFMSAMSTMLAIPLIKLIAFVAGLFLISLILKRLFLLYKPFHSIICPKCQSNLYRQKRNILTRAITNYLGIRGYFCRNCHWKGFRLSVKLLQDYYENPSS